MEEDVEKAIRERNEYFKKVNQEYRDRRIFEERRARRAMAEWALIIVIFVTPIVLLITFGPWLRRIIAYYLSEPVRTWRVNIFGTLGIIALGYSLYQFKKFARMQYGMVEISFAIAAGWQAISKATSAGIGEGIAIVAAIYFIVRGMDNINLAKEAKKNKLGAGPETTS